MVLPPVKSILKANLSRAALLACMIEAGMLAGLVWAMAQAHPHTEPPTIKVMLSFPVLPTPVKPETPPPPKPVIRHAVHPAIQPQQAQPRPQPLLPPLPQDPTPVSQPKPPPVTAAPVSTPQVTAPVTPPAPVQPDPHLLATFNEQVLGAIQSAVNYPLAARMAHMHGRTRVGFTYLDGVVSNVTVITTSGYRLLDDAAIQAVMTAHYPTPPANLRSRPLPFSLWVNHELRNEEDD